MSLASLCNSHSFTVQQPTYTRDESGGMVVTWTARGGTRRGMVQDMAELSMTQAPLAGRTVQNSSYQIYCLPASGADIQQGDRVTLEDGTILRVWSINKNRGVGTIGTFYRITGGNTQDGNGQGSNAT
jgi:hypothetical protein